jgi:hypothetical protein
MRTPHKKREASGDLRSSLLALSLALVFSGVAQESEGTTFGIHDWDDGPHGWVSEFGDVTLTRESTGGNPNGYLNINFPPTSAPEILENEWVDIIRIDAALLFAGNWRTDMTLSFDFFASNQTPHDIQLQFHSTNNNVWGYNLTSAVTNTQQWTGISTPLAFDSAWGPLPGFSDTADQFLADLSAIDWIGIYIFRETAGGENYGIDNFRLHLIVPEPAEFAMLAAVLIAAALGYRRQQKDAGRSPAVPVAGNT